jgi:cell filamentation protein
VSRYDAVGSEGRHAEDSDGRVLANKLGISDPAEMDEAELFLLEQLYVAVLADDLPRGMITVERIKSWHRRWLGNVYEWAGQERSVNISKEGFMFALAGQVPKLLAGLEQNCLTKYTPCVGFSEARLIEAIAVTHVELILIHPFREGNGRISRLLADVMAVQAGFEPLDYSSWERNKRQYIAAIHQGLDMNYGPMKDWVARAMAAD